MSRQRATESKQTLLSLYRRIGPSKASLMTPEMHVSICASRDLTYLFLISRFQSRVYSILKKHVLNKRLTVVGRWPIMLDLPSGPSQPETALSPRAEGDSTWCNFCLLDFRSFDPVSHEKLVPKHPAANHCVYCNSPRRSTHFGQDTVQQIKQSIQEDTEYRANWFLRSFAAAVMFQRNDQVDPVVMRTLPWISARDWPVPAPTAQELVEYRLVPHKDLGKIARAEEFVDVVVSGGYSGKAIPSSLIGSDSLDEFMIVPPSQRLTIEGSPPFWDLFLKKDLNSVPFDQWLNVLSDTNTSPRQRGQKRKVSGQVCVSRQMQHCLQLELEYQTAVQNLKSTPMQEIVKPSTRNFKEFQKLAKQLETQVTTLSTKTIPGEMRNVVIRLKTHLQNARNILGAIMAYRDYCNIEDNGSAFLHQKLTSLGFKAGTESEAAGLPYCIAQDFDKVHALEFIAKGNYREFWAHVSTWDPTQLLRNMSDAMGDVLCSEELGEVKPVFQQFMAAADLPDYQAQAELIWIES